MNKARFKRNEDGLFDHVEYKFDDNGYIDWKAMIPKEFFVINKERAEKDGMIEIDVEKVEEKYLLILLGGIKYIAKLRGYNSCHITVKYASDTKVVCECHMIWNSNYETEGNKIDFSGIGEATLDNTKGFGQLFLAPIAENRAFIRCVRNFLNINIVASDEIVGGHALDSTGPSKVADLPPSAKPTSLLEKALKDKGSGFNALKAALIKRGGDEAKEAEKWNSIKDIPERRIMALVSLIKNANPKKKRGRPRKNPE